MLIFLIYYNIFDVGLFSFRETEIRISNFENSTEREREPRIDALVRESTTVLPPLFPPLFLRRFSFI